MTSRTVTIYTCNKCHATGEGGVTERPSNWRYLTGHFATGGGGWEWDLCPTCYGKVACSMGSHESPITPDLEQRKFCWRCSERLEW